MVGLPNRRGAAASIFGADFDKLRGVFYTCSKADGPLLPGNSGIWVQPLQLDASRGCPPIGVVQVPAAAPFIPPQAPARQGFSAGAATESNVASVSIIEVTIAKLNSADKFELTHTRAASGVGLGKRLGHEKSIQVKRSKGYV